MGLMRNEREGCENCGEAVPQLSTKQKYDAMLIYCRHCFYVAKNMFSSLKGVPQTSACFIQLISDINEDTLQSNFKSSRINDEDITKLQELRMSTKADELAAAHREKMKFPGVCCNCNARDLLFPNKARQHQVGLLFCRSCFFVFKNKHSDLKGTVTCGRERDQLITDMYAEMNAESSRLINLLHDRCRRLNDMKF